MASPEGQHRSPEFTKGIGRWPFSDADARRIRDTLSKDDQLDGAVDKADAAFERALENAGLSPLLVQEVRDQFDSVYEGAAADVGTKAIDSRNALFADLEKRWAEAKKESDAFLDKQDVSPKQQAAFRAARDAYRTALERIFATKMKSLHDSELVTTGIHGGSGKEDFEQSEMSEAEKEREFERVWRGLMREVTKIRLDFGIRNRSGALSREVITAVNTVLRGVTSAGRPSVVRTADGNIDLVASCKAARDFVLQTVSLPPGSLPQESQHVATEVFELTQRGGELYNEVERSLEAALEDVYVSFTTKPASTGLSKKVGQTKDAALPDFDDDEPTEEAVRVVEDEHADTEVDTGIDNSATPENLKNALLSYEKLVSGQLTAAKDNAGIFRFSDPSVTDVIHERIAAATAFLHGEIRRVAPQTDDELRQVLHRVSNQIHGILIDVSNSFSSPDHGRATSYLLQYDNKIASFEGQGVLDQSGGDSGQVTNKDKQRRGNKPVLDSMVEFVDEDVEFVSDGSPAAKLLERTERVAISIENVLASAEQRMEASVAYDRWDDVYAVAKKVIRAIPETLLRMPVVRKDDDYSVEDVAATFQSQVVVAIDQYMREMQEAIDSAVKQHQPGILRPKKRSQFIRNELYTIHQLQDKVRDFAEYLAAVVPPDMFAQSGPIGVYADKVLQLSSTSEGESQDPFAFVRTETRERVVEEKAHPAAGVVIDRFTQSVQDFIQTSGVLSSDKPEDRDLSRSAMKDRTPVDKSRSRVMREDLQELIGDLRDVMHAALSGTSVFEGADTPERVRLICQQQMAQRIDRMFAQWQGYSEYKKINTSAFDETVTQPLMRSLRGMEIQVNAGGAAGTPRLSHLIESGVNVSRVEPLRRLDRREAVNLVQKLLQDTSLLGLGEEEMQQDVILAERWKGVKKQLARIDELQQSGALPDSLHAVLGEWAASLRPDRTLQERRENARTAFERLITAIGGQPRELFGVVLEETALLEAGSFTVIPDAGSPANSTSWGMRIRGIQPTKLGKPVKALGCEVGVTFYKDQSGPTGNKDWQAIIEVAPPAGVSDSVASLQKGTEYIWLDQYDLQDPQVLARRLQRIFAHWHNEVSQAVIRTDKSSLKDIHVPVGEHNQALGEAQKKMALSAVSKDRLSLHVPGRQVDVSLAPLVSEGYPGVISDFSLRPEPYRDDQGVEWRVIHLTAGYESAGGSHEYARALYIPHNNTDATPYIGTIDTHKQLVELSKGDDVVERLVDDFSDWIATREVSPTVQVLQKEVGQLLISRDALVSAAAGGRVVQLQREGIVGIEAEFETPQTEGGSYVLTITGAQEANGDPISLRAEIRVPSIKERVAHRKMGSDVGAVLIVESTGTRNGRPRLYQEIAGKGETSGDITKYLFSEVEQWLRQVQKDNALEATYLDSVYQKNVEKAEYRTSAAIDVLRRQAQAGSIDLYGVTINPSEVIGQDGEGSVAAGLENVIKQSNGADGKVVQKVIGKNAVVRVTYKVGVYTAVGCVSFPYDAAGSSTDIEGLKFTAEVIDGNGDQVGKTEQALEDIESLKDALQMLKDWSATPKKVIQEMRDQHSEEGGEEQSPSMGLEQVRLRFHQSGLLEAGDVSVSSEDPELAVVGKKNKGGPDITMSKEGARVIIAYTYTFITSASVVTKKQEMFELTPNDKAGHIDVTLALGNDENQRFQLASVAHPEDALRLVKSQMVKVSTELVAWRKKKSAPPGYEAAEASVADDEEEDQSETQEGNILVDLPAMARTFKRDGKIAYQGTEVLDVASYAPQSKSAHGPHIHFALNGDRGAIDIAVSYGIGDYKHQAIFTLEPSPGKGLIKQLQMREKIGNEREERFPRLVDESTVADVFDNIAEWMREERDVIENIAKQMDVLDAEIPQSATGGVVTIAGRPISLERTASMSTGRFSRGSLQGDGSMDLKIEFKSLANQDDRFHVLLPVQVDKNGVLKVRGGEVQMAGRGRRRVYTQQISPFEATDIGQIASVLEEGVKSIHVELDRKLSPPDVFAIQQLDREFGQAHEIVGGEVDIAGIKLSLEDMLLEGESLPAFFKVKSIRFHDQKYRVQCEAGIKASADTEETQSEVRVEMHFAAPRNLTAGAPLEDPKLILHIEPGYSEEIQFQDDVSLDILVAKTDEALALLRENIDTKERSGELLDSSLSAANPTDRITLPDGQVLSFGEEGIFRAAQIMRVDRGQADQKSIFLQRATQSGQEYHATIDLQYEFRNWSGDISVSIDGGDAIAEFAGEIDELTTTEVFQLLKKVDDQIKSYEMRRRNVERVKREVLNPDTELQNTLLERAQAEGLSLAPNSKDLTWLNGELGFAPYKYMREEVASDGSLKKIEETILPIGRDTSDGLLYLDVQSDTIGVVPKDTLMLVARSQDVLHETFEPISPNDL